MTNSKSRPHVIIIGGSSGIGKELVLKFSKNNNVSVLARRIDRLEDLAANSTNVNAAPCDVNSFDEFRVAIDQSVLIFGKINIMIYCAGQQIIKPHRLMTEHDIDSLYNVNLRGALLAAKMFCSVKVSEKDAVYCCISSIAGANPEPGIVGYSCMKAALDAMIFGLAKESAPRRFVGVAPGWLDTEMTQGQSVYNEKFKAVLEKQSPLGITSIENVVDAVVFMVSGQASAVTGVILPVDSGVSA